MSPVIQSPYAGLAETHTAIVFFVGDRAYKLKKPVSLGFLDFSRLETRAVVCRREVELNRRFAPDVYLDVATITDSAGQPCDYLVVMRRMPAERRLATLLARGETVEHEIRQIARLVAGFHAQAPTSPEMASVATRDAVQGHWEASFEQMRPFVGPVLDPAVNGNVESLARRYLAGRAPLFSQRIAQGRVRDGHGDLLADDIFCLADGPRILDCLEFDDRLRWGDVLADVAFLAMDLERLGTPELATRFLAWYREFSGETYPQSLAEHYIAYRAHVRSKVACLRYAQGDAAAAAEANQFLLQANRHLQRGRVVLALVGGLPGTGKSTLATGISDALDWAVLRSDEVRKDLAGISHDAQVRERFREGLYEPEVTAATYRELLTRARTALELGESVVLDATFSDRAWRQAAAGLASATSSDLIELRCELGPAEAAARLATRVPGAAYGSDATAEVAAAMAAAADPWPSAITVDMSGSPARSLAAALEAFTFESILLPELAVNADVSV
ncbi:MAG TPA: AAA family ATPase [Candidatus Dormibacteraeota bacterium]